MEVVYILIKDTGKNKIKYENNIRTIFWISEMVVLICKSLKTSQIELARLR